VKRGKRLAVVAAAATIILIAGCGGTAWVTNTGSTSSAEPATTALPSPANVGNVYSASYCWHLSSGRWVTGKPNSTTACVPDPSYATGNQQDDGAVPLPRCYTCKPSDWTRAEAHAAAALQASGGDVNTAPHRWPPSVRSRFVTACADDATAKSLCGCIANILGRQIPADQFNDGDTSIDDPRVQGAITTCKSAAN
jgi:hypothetical protein